MYRQYRCKYCGYIDTYDAIAGSGRVWIEPRKPHNIHYNTCDHYPLECPNRCGEKSIKRKDMETHQQMCPSEPLNCPFKSVGCTDEILRKDMDTHTQMSTQAHLLLVVHSYEELARKNEELVRKNEQLTESNHKLSARLEKLEKNSY